MHRLYQLVAVCSLSLGCGSQDPVEIFESEINSYGFIPFSTPLESARTGTLIGGSPERMMLVAPWDTCFPDQLGDQPTNLRRIDNTSLPARSQTLSFSGEARFGLLDIMNRGNPMVKAGARFQTLTKVELSYQRPQIEFMDSINLTEFYRNQISSQCKDYLEHVGFIIEAIKVDRMRFSFFDARSGRIQLTLENIEEILDIALDINWRIENEFNLVIESPKYIGYRLGRLKSNDEGLALYRASRVEDQRYVFESIDIFDPIIRVDSLTSPKPLPEAFKIDPYSRYK